MIDIKNVKIGDRVQVSSECAYTFPDHQEHMESKVCPGDLGVVTEIDTSKMVIEHGWPIRVLLDGHEEAYPYGLNEIDYVE